MKNILALVMTLVMVLCMTACSATGSNDPVVTDTSAGIAKTDTPTAQSQEPVSYTHLDVYKRQLYPA